MDTSKLFDVKNKVAVVTGATGILGGAMARGLAAHGCRVAVAGRNAERAAKAVRDIESAGGKAMSLQLDVTARDSVKTAAESVLEKWGSVDILVNSAGGNNPEATVTEDHPFFDIPGEALREVMKLNMLGTVIPCQEFGRHMAERGEGCIVNISSMAAQLPLTKVVAYSASKAAIDNFTRWLAVHMATVYGSAIRVNAIAPGFFLTEQNRYLLQDKAGSPTPRGKTVLDHTPMGRFGEPDELISTLLWLVSPGAAFVTGTAIPVDGGFSAFSGV